MHHIYIGTRKSKLQCPVGSTVQGRVEDEGCGALGSREGRKDSCCKTTESSDCPWRREDDFGSELQLWDGA